MFTASSSLTWALAAVTVALITIPAVSRPRAQTSGPAQPGAAPGDALFNTKCAQCHGTAGDGNGIASAYLSPRPRDFRQGRYKVRTTESGSLPTDEDIRKSIREGMHGSSMPAWQPFLSDSEVTALVAKVKTFSPRFATEQPKPVTIGPEIPASPEGLAAGRVVYQRLMCAACHGADGTGADAVATELMDDWNRPTRASNLTEPWTFRGGAAPRDIYFRFLTGMNGSPMPSYATAATDAEMWNLAHYVVSLGRKPVWKMTADEIKAFYAAQDEAARRDAVARGRYLVNSMGCHDCHTPIQRDGSQIEELNLAGGQRWTVVPYGDRFTANLTSDKETGLGNVSDELIKRTLTRGIRRDGTRMLPFPMPWTAYGSMRASDLDAIVAYLRSLPPIINRIPAPRPPNIVSYLAGKFRWLIIGTDPPAIVFPGNAGSAQPKATAQAGLATGGAQ